MNKKTSEVKKWSGTVEDCNICLIPLKDFPAFIDGRTIQGPWALMCPTCFRMYGVGLGEGFGQKYDYHTREKIAG